MQPTIATSSTVAGSFALFEASRQAIWIQKLFRGLRIPEKDKTTQLWCDNQATIQNVNNIGFHEGTKHVDVKCFFVQEKIVEKKVKVNYISTFENVADVFTKALDYGKHTKLITLGMKLHDAGEC